MASKPEPAYEHQREDFRDIEHRHFGGLGGIRPERVTTPPPAPAPVPAPEQDKTQQK